MLEEAREIYSREDNKYGQGSAMAVMAALEKRPQRAERTRPVLVSWPGRLLRLPDESAGE